MKYRLMLLWVARILSAAVVIFIAFFLTADLVVQGSFDSMTTTDVFAFACFPVGALLGLITSFVKHRLGALLAIGSMIILVIIRPDLMTSWPIFAMVLVPAFLWLMLSRMK